MKEVSEYVFHLLYSRLSASFCECTALMMDDEIIPDPAIIMVKSEPLEQQSENYIDPFVAMVIAVHL
jgi:hypothetical protein